MSFKLPSLPYELNALEPILSKQIVELHYLKHHNGYVNNLNAALKKYEEAFKKNDLTAMIELQSLITFNGGGHFNHSFFWNTLMPYSKNKPSNNFLKVINDSFGSFDNLVSEFNRQSLAVQGSGWSWIGYDRGLKKLRIATTKNHGLIDFIPLLIVDLWEHAYYLQYKNERNTYLNEIWKILNWPEIEKRYIKSLE